MPHFHTAPNAVSVVVGASRGLGLALSAALLQRSTGRVVALARQPEEAPALMALQEASGGRLSCFSCDVTDYESLRTMAEHVKEAESTFIAALGPDQRPLAEENEGNEKKEGKEESEEPPHSRLTEPQG